MGAEKRESEHSAAVPEKSAESHSARQKKDETAKQRMQPFGCSEYVMRNPN